MAALSQEEIKAQELPISDENLAEVDSIISEFKGRPGSLIPVLHKSQMICGYLSQTLQKRIAHGLDVPESEVLGVVSFYSFFSMVPRGRHIIKVCLGTACYVKGGNKISDKIVRELGVEVGCNTDDMKFTYEVVRCLGACGRAPVMTVNEATHGLVEAERVMGLLTQYE